MAGKLPLGNKMMSCMAVVLMRIASITPHKKTPHKNGRLHRIIEEHIKNYHSLNYRILLVMQDKVWTNKLLPL
jgi:hypothetical protein